VKPQAETRSDDRSGNCLASAKASGSPARQRPTTQPAPSLVQSLHLATTGPHTRRNPSTTTIHAITILARLTGYFARKFTRFLTPILAALTRLRAVAARRFTASCAASQPDLRPRSQPACQSRLPLVGSSASALPHVTTTPNVLHSRFQCTACTSTETQHKAAIARN
jgi:hypothetical protein